MAPQPVWLTQRDDGAVLSVWVKPRASKTRITGVHGTALAVQLAAPPVDGAANDELIRFVAEWVGVPRRQVSLLSGDTSRGKRVLVTGVSLELVAALQL